jgi:hypothetical protein
MDAGRRNLLISGFPQPLPTGGQKGGLRRLHFMRPFAPCFAKSVASPRVYPMRRRERAVMTGSQLAGNNSSNKRASNWSYATEPCSCT